MHSISSVDVKSGKYEVILGVASFNWGLIVEVAGMKESI